MVTRLRNTKFDILRASATPVSAPAEVERLDYLNESWDLDDLNESWDLDDLSWAWLRREQFTWTAAPW